MNLLLSTLTSFVILSTGVSIAPVENNTAVLNQIRDAIYIVNENSTKKVVDESIIKKDIDFARAQLLELLQQLNQDIKNTKDLKIRKMYLNQLNATSLYLMALNDVELYLQTNDTNYLSDALIEYRLGNAVLNNI